MQKYFFFFLVLLREPEVCFVFNSLRPEANKIFTSTRRERGGKSDQKALVTAADDNHVLK